MINGLIDKRMVSHLSAAICGVIIFFAGSVQANEPNLPVADANKETGTKSNHVPLKGRIAELNMKLNLTSDQQVRIVTILDTEARELKAAKIDKALKGAQKGTKIQEIRTQTNEQIDKLLTPQQQKKFAVICPHKEHNNKTASNCKQG